MIQNGLPLRDLPVLQRIRRVALGSLVFSLFGTPLYLSAISGGRFQSDHGSATDMWLLAILYPVGVFLSGIVAVLFGGWWSRRLTAGLATGVSALPFYVLISLAVGHSGPTAPYRLDWSLVLGCAGTLAVTVIVFYQYLVRRMELAKQRVRRRRESAA